MANMVCMSACLLVCTGTAETGSFAALALASVAANKIVN